MTYPLGAWALRTLRTIFKKRVSSSSIPELTSPEEHLWNPDAGTTGITAVKSQFLIAAKQVAADLGVDWKEVQHDVYDTNPNELMFTASGQTHSGIPSFNFVVSCKVHDSQRTEPKSYIRAGIEIEYEHATKWDIDDDITSMVGHPNYLIRWAGWAIHNFNLEHNPVNLKSRIGYHAIEVYGGDREDWSLTQFELLMKGLQSSRSKVTVLRLRHVSKNNWYRSYSYAIWAESGKWPGLWIFFYNMGGLDSGGWYSCYKWVEETIAELGNNVTVETHDINDRALVHFLLREDTLFRRSIHLSPFEPESLYPSLSLSDMFFSESDLGREAVETYKKAEDSFFVGDFEGALRDLRAAVQDALENTVQRQGIDISGIKDLDITKLVGMLVKADKLDGKLTSWFGAFTSFANLASHRTYPAEKELSNPQIRLRVLGTFVLGRHLLQEIGYCVKPTNHLT